MKRLFAKHSGLRVLAVMLSAGVVGTFTTACNLKKGSIELKCEATSSEVQRHDTLQFTVELKNVKASDVTYAVTGSDATIDATGKLTVKDDAAVGHTFSVSASAGKVKSNVKEFTIVDTMPTQISAVPSKAVLIEGEEVSFSVSFYPTYSTIKEYNIEVSEGSELAEVVDKKLKLKEGVVVAEHAGDEVRVKASLASDPSVKDEVSIYVGQTGGFLRVSPLSIIARKQATANVPAALYDENGTLVENPETPFTYESSNTDVFTVSEEGVVTAKGHGTATVTVRCGSLQKSATVNVILSPQSIEVDGVTTAIRERGFKFAKGGEFEVSVNSTKEEKYTQVSDTYKYDLKLFDGETLVTDVDAEIATVTGNKIKFLRTGRVQLDVLSNSSLANVEVDAAYEAKATVMFDVNEGVNVKTLAELKAALANESVVDVNLVKTINVTTGDLEKSDNNSYQGLPSYGDKALNGNGYAIDLSSVALSVPSSKELGGRFISFRPTANTSSEKAHQPYNVKIFDITLRGNTDYDGNALDGSGNAFVQRDEKEWESFYRAGFNIGYGIDRKDFIDDDGSVFNSEYCGAYVDKPVLTNVTVEGFYWGLLLIHNVDGVLTNVHTVNGAEKGILSQQCTLKLVNPSFGKNGSFCIELTQDGVNNLGRASAPAGKEDQYKVEPTAGKNFNEASVIDMVGDIHVNNYTTGLDTTYLKGYGAKLSAMGFGSISELCEAIMGGTAQAVVEGVNAQAGNILNNDQKAALTAQLANLGLDIFYDDKTAGANKKSNFFALSFMQDLDLAHHTNESVDDYAVVKENGETAIKMTDIMIQEALAFLKPGSPHYIDYKSHKYVDLELNAGSVHLGKAVIINNQYVAPTAA